MSQQSVGYLLLKCSRVVSRLYQKELYPHGITAPQSAIIALLGERGEMGQSDICTALNLDKANASIMLRRMINDGLVKDRGHEKDRRQVLHSLTPKGKKLVPIVREIDEKVNKMLHESLGTRLSEQTFKTLTNLYGDEKLR
jgi:MarR family transcriptional regulator for hemolysin